MEEILQCPRCVDLAAAEGKAISASDFQLIMNAETTDWGCHNGHIIKGQEIEAIMTELATPAEPKKPLTKEEKKAAKQAANAHAREENTPLKQGESGGQTGGSEVPAGGNDPKQETEASAPVVNDADDVCDGIQVTRESVSGLLEVGVKVENGNLVIAVEIPEMYVEAAETLARENGQTVREWAQQRMEFYLESEFAMVKTV